MLNFSFKDTKRLLTILIHTYKPANIWIDALSTSCLSIVSLCFSLSEVRKVLWQHPSCIMVMLGHHHSYSVCVCSWMKKCLLSFIWLTSYINVFSPDIQGFALGTEPGVSRQVMQAQILSSFTSKLCFSVLFLFAQQMAGSDIKAALGNFSFCADFGGPRVRLHVPSASLPVARRLLPQEESGRQLWRRTFSYLLKQLEFSHLMSWKNPTQRQAVRITIRDQ